MEISPFVMLSLCRSLLRPQRVTSMFATSYRRNLLYTSICPCDRIPTFPRPSSGRRNERPLLKSKTAVELQKIVTLSQCSMNPDILIDCLVRFKNIAQSTRGGGAVTDDPCFEKLARKVASKLDSPSFQYCNVLLRTAIQLELDLSHTLLQRILEKLAARIQCMDLDQIMTLSSQVKQIKGESSLKEDCLLAAQTAFEIRVKEKLDRTNRAQCLSALDFILRNNLSLEVQRFVIDVAQGFLAQAGPETVAEIVCSLAFHEPGFVTVKSSEIRNFIENCLSTLAENLIRFDQKEVRRIMAAYDNMDIFSNELNNAFWAMAASLTFEEAMTLFITIGHTKIRLKDLELLKEFLLANTDRVGDLGASDCAHSMAMLALHSPGVHKELGEIGRLLAAKLDQPDFHVRKSTYFDAFVRDLAILGIFPEKELDYLFSEKYQNSLFLRSEDRRGRAYRFIDLERLLRVRFGESCRYIAMPELRIIAVGSQPIDLAEDLVESVRRAVGGDQFISRNVVTPFGTEADLVVATSADGKLIDLSDKALPLEELPDGAKVVAILQCLREYHFDDFKTRRLPFLLREHFLRVQRICPVVINMVEWESVPSEKKVSFLMSKIECAIAQMHKKQQVEKNL